MMVRDAQKSSPCSPPTSPTSPEGLGVCKFRPGRSPGGGRLYCPRPDMRRLARRPHGDCTLGKTPCRQLLSHAPLPETHTCVCRCEGCTYMYIYVNTHMHDFTHQYACMFYWKEADFSMANTSNQSKAMHLKASLASGPFTFQRQHLLAEF